MTNSTKYNLGIILVLSIAALALTIWGRMMESDRKKNRVVVLSYVYEVSEAEVGKLYKSYYFYDQKKYFSTISYPGPPRLEVGTLIFTEISSENPDNANLLNEINVPTCITLDSMPPMGWKAIPTCDTK